MSAPTSEIARFLLFDVNLLFDSDIAWAWFGSRGSFFFRILVRRDTLTALTSILTVGAMSAVGL